MSDQRTRELERAAAAGDPEAAVALQAARCRAGDHSGAARVVAGRVTLYLGRGESPGQPVPIRQAVEVNSTRCDACGGDLELEQERTLRPLLTEDTVSRETGRFAVWIPSCASGHHFDDGAVFIEVHGGATRPWQRCTRCEKTRAVT